jgi:hypothetical protein
MSQNMKHRGRTTERVDIANPRDGHPHHINQTIEAFLRLLLGFRTVTKTRLSAIMVRAFAYVEVRAISSVLPPAL